MAKATIGKLSAILSLNAAQFSKGLNKAAKRTSSFSKSLIGITKKVALFGTALVTAAVAGLSVLVKSQFSTIDALAKTSDKLGITTEGLAGLQFAAEQTGVKTKTMDMALQRMVRRLSEAAVGTGEAQGALKELGIDATEIVKLPVDEQFKTIADAMSKVSTQADKVRLGFKLFDSEGVALVNTLSLGRDGLEEMTKKAKQFGAALSREGAAKVEETNKSFGEFVLLLKGATTQIAVQLAPFVTALLDKLVALGSSGESMAKKVSGAFEKILKAMAKTSDFFAVVQAGFFALRAAVMKGLSLIVDGIKILIEGVVFLLNKLPTVKIDVEASTEFLADFAGGLDEAAGDAKEKMEAAWDNFLMGDAEKKVTRFFNSVKDDAAEAAAAVAKKAGELGPGLDPFDGKLGAGGVSAADSVGGAPTSFLQGNINRMAFGGGDEIQDVKGDPEQTDLLRNILLALEIGLKPTPQV